MVENTVRVVVDEALWKYSGESYLVAQLLVDGTMQTQMCFNRGADPQQISDTLLTAGCFIKYDEDIELPEEERQNIGDLYIEASYNVPGIKKE